MTDRKRPTVLCAGGAVQDIVMRVEQFPEPGHKVQASDFIVTIGGQSGNAAVATARLGARTLYAGTIGASDDPVAQQIVDALETKKKPITADSIVDLYERTYRGGQR